MSLALRIAAFAHCLAPLALAAAAPGIDADRRERPDDPPRPVQRAAQPRAPSAVVVRGRLRSVQVNVDVDGQNIVGDAANEPSLAVDPLDPRNLVIGWRQFDSVLSNFRQAGYAYSRDGGSTWTFPGVLQPGQFRSDPVLGADSDGTIFYYSLSALSSAEMFVSQDRGETWIGPLPGFGGDKPWIVVDAGFGPGGGNVYVTWNADFTCCAAGTDFTRSIDGGLTYEGPWSLPVKARWGTLDVGPDGELYLVGVSGAGFPAPHVVERSTNAANAAETPVFESAAPVILGGETAFGGTPNPGGLTGQVWVAVDRSAGPGRGNVYVLGSVDPPGADPLDVQFVRSTDGGATWSPPLRVNDDPPNGNAWQWFGTMSVAPNGRIDVIWNDTRNGPPEMSEVFYAYSLDAGSSWSAGLPVTPPWNSLVGHPNQNKIGDYYHMISDLDGASLAYAATFNGEQDIWFLRVGDCNGNRVHDALDVASATAEDCNANGIPDTCEEELLCPTCDDDALCEPLEDCRSCAGDCPDGAAGCGNAVCEPGLGEDCVSCPQDCNGLQSGSQALRFCCGDGDGDNPVDCRDARCISDGFLCSEQALPDSCCGDGVCSGAEDVGSCAVDCDTADADADGVPDSVDCAPADPGAFRIPVEVRGVAFDDATSLTWRSAAPGAGAATVYDVVRGRLDELPVGTGPAEICLSKAGGETLLRDEADPAAGAGWYYVVRASNACGDGDYGVAFSGAPRASAVCD